MIALNPPIDVETDENGVASTSVPAGSYSIDADDPPCFMNSSASNQDGGIDVTADQPVSVELFVCT